MGKNTKRRTASFFVGALEFQFSNPLPLLSPSFPPPQKNSPPCRGWWEVKEGKVEGGGKYSKWPPPTHLIKLLENNFKINFKILL